MANMFEKYAADREAEQKKIEQTVSEPAAAKQTTVSADAAPAEDEKRTTLSPVAHGERQEGAEDDGGGARDDDCRDYPRMGRGAFGKVI